MGTQVNLVDLAAKFWPFVDKTPGLGPRGDCWEWRGAKSTGYGTISMGLHGHLHAHRASWLLAHGSFTKGLLVCHSCDNRKCVNPEHLSEGTHSSNLKEAYDRGCRKPSRRKPKTHCPQGHELADENLYISPAGHRQCKKCRKAAWQRVAAHREK